MGIHYKGWRAWWAGGDAAGRRTRNVLPDPGSLRTRSSPWFRSAMDREIASPKPRPRALVVKNGSMTRAIWSGGIPGPVSVTSISTNGPSLLPVIVKRPRDHAVGQLDMPFDP